MIEGVSEGYKELQLVGVGYTADASSNKFLLLTWIFSSYLF